MAGSAVFSDTVGEVTSSPSGGAVIFDTVSPVPTPSGGTTVLDLVGDLPVLGPGADAPIEAFIDPLGPGVDANVDFVPGVSLGPGVDAETDFILITYLGAPTGGAVPVPDPVRSFGGATGARFQLGEPAFVFGGPVNGLTQVGPTYAFGGTTGGQIVYADVPPATKLIAIPVSTGKIALTWTDVSDRETGFRIERSLNGQGAWSPIGVVGEDVTIFVDTNATPLVVFDYRVIAFNSAAEAIPSNVASAYSPAPGQAPPPPSAPVPRRVLDYLSPGVYGVERDLDGNTGGAKS